MIDNDDSDTLSGHLAAAVDEAVASGGFGPSEAAVVALARRYAYEIDTAHLVEAEFEALMKSGDLEGASAWRRLSKLEDKVRAASVVADVGPRLLAALESLGLSPQARAKLTKGIVEPAAPPVEDPKKAKLKAMRDELGAKRAERMGS